MRPNVGKPTAHYLVGVKATDEDRTQVKKVRIKTFDARTVGRWRAWLEAHHHSEREIWLVFYKPHTGVTSIAYQDALDEALCVGWVDSLIRRLDDARYARKFTPRKPDSRWSATNRRRYRELKAAGRMQPAGLDRAPTARGSAPRPAAPRRVPAYIRAAFDSHAAARRHFAGLPPSEQRRYVLWIDSAKRSETKRRRLAEATRLLVAGKRLGLK